MMIKKQTNSTDTANENSEISELLFSNGKKYFTSMIADINHAKHSIFMESYIFKRDTLGNEIITALVAAKKRGVTVKVMVDGVGSPFFAAVSQALDKAKIETKIFHPFPWHVWHWSRSVVKLPFLLKSIYLLLNMSKRNHRKICLIDNSILYVGSLNIAQEHLPSSCGGDNWRDLGIKLSNTKFNKLTEALEHCWEHQSIKEVLRKAFKRVGKDPIIRLNNTRHRRRILYKQLLRNIHHAKHRVWITNPYFVPDDYLIRKLREAAKKNVDVRILLPQKSDTLLPIPWAAACCYERLLQAGVKIYEYIPNILHAKSFIIDNWAMIGSSNLDFLSLIHNLEIDIRLSHQKTIDQAAHYFLDDLKKSEQIIYKQLPKHKNRHWFKRFFGRIMLFLRYWI